MLVVGAIVAIAVSWATAVTWYPPYGDMGMADTFVGKARTERGTYIAERAVTPLVTVVRMLRSDPGVPAFDERLHDPETLRALGIPELGRPVEYLPPVQRDVSFKDLRIPAFVERERYAVVASYGWPARAFYSWATGTEVDCGQRSGTIHSALRVRPPRHYRWKGQDGRTGNYLADVPDGAIPLGIHWPGLVMSSVFWALALAACVASAGALRRNIRRGRGLCPACGYSRAGLAGDAACPECGVMDRKSKPLPSAAATSAGSGGGAGV